MKHAMEQIKEYFAFISYKSEDVEWAIWVQHELEHYHLPASFNGRTDVRQELRPVFRDIDELSAGNLPEQIKQALFNSQNLIVICSPQAAKSPWVNQEAETFISLGRTDRIFPFIVEGNSPKEFFPPSLLKLPKNEERLGGDVSKNGRDSAFVKVVAGMLGVGFGSLWNRYEMEKAEEERKIREQRDHLLKVQARFLSEKICQLTDDGDSYTARLLALEILPSNSHPDYPYTIEAEIALRKACSNDNRMFQGHKGCITSLAISPDGKKLASASLDNSIMLWDVNACKCLAKLEKPSLMSGPFRYDLLDNLVDEIDFAGFNSVTFSSNGEIVLAAGCDATIYVWDLNSMECIAKMSNHDIHWPISHAIFKTDMKTIISSGVFNEDFTKGLAVWSLDNCRLISDGSDSDESHYVSISPDGRFIASAHQGYVEVWNSESLQREFVLKSNIKNSSYLDRPMAIFSPDGLQIAFSLLDSIHIWDFMTHKLLMVIKNNGKKIHCIAYMPDGKHIVSGGVDKIVSIWNLSNGECTRQLKGHASTINTIAISKDGSYIYSAGDDYNIRLWSIKNNVPDSNTCSITNDNIDKTKGAISNKVYKTSYHVDRNAILVNCLSNNSISFFLQSPYATPIQFITLSPDGNNMLTFSYNNEMYICTNLSALSDEMTRRINPNQNIYRVQEFSIAEQNLLVLKGHAGIIRCATFSPDGNYVVSCSDDHTIRVWDSRAGQCIQVFVVNGNINRADFSNDGENIIIKSYDETVNILRFPSLPQLIAETQNILKNRTLTTEERKKYYLE